MYPHFSTEQKAAARALLDLHYPSQELVAAAVGTTRQSMTTWVNRWTWRFVDFRKADARRAFDRLRLTLLREHGHNVSDLAKLGPLDVQDLEATPVETDGRAGAPVGGAAGALLGRLRSQTENLNDALLRQFASRAPTLTLAMLEQAQALRGLMIELGDAMQADAKAVWAQAATAMDDDIAMRAVAMLEDPKALRGMAEAMEDHERDLAAAYENLADLLERHKGKASRTAA